MASKTVLLVCALAFLLLSPAYGLEQQQAPPARGGLAQPLARKLLQWGPSLTIRRGSNGPCTVAVPYNPWVGNVVGGNWLPNFVTLGRGSPRCQQSG
ncbi:MAG: hypothetical protein J3K34DRAFT_517545 [Monoraphidium minutum]|nr:MAG: hypothetical protein J3K34DRAFT_517545 [Monoraphidium minutum]